MRSKTSRLLALLLILAFAPGAAQQAPPDPTALLRSGPMLGPAEPAEATIWLQTTRPCRVQVRFWEEGRSETARLSPETATADASDLIAKLRLPGLRFGTRYEYEVYLDGLRLPRSYPLVFQTQALWRWRADPPDFRAALGSCTYVNDPPYDRPGDPYGGNPEIFRAIAAQKPDLMLWLGDNVYYREGDWTTEAGMRYRWAHSRGLPEMQPLLGAAHNYAIWDDHDFGPNNSDRTYRERETSLRVFADYWMNPTYGLPETPGVFTRFEWSDAEFFLLDDRYHRSPNDEPEGPDKRMFGRAQLDWLKGSLRSSQATFKIVVGGNQFWNPIVDFEALGRFPAEQGELLDFLRDTKIEGVVFVSGDRHHTELIKRVEPGLYPLYEFTSSPLTSGTANNQKEKDNPARVPGTWVTTVRNFGLIEVTGKPKERVLRMRTLDPQGKELWKYEVREGELRF